MIELHLLEQLRAFAKYGTLSAAAEHLHTSQPALTRSMKKLEEELGVTLFIRKKNHLSLNETGARAAGYAAKVLNESMEFEAKVRAFDRSLHTLCIGYCAPVPQSVLTPLINAVFDGMTISADMKDDARFLDNLRIGEYDLAVVHEEPESDEFYYKKCGHEELYISVLPSDPLTFYPEVHLADLNGKTILLLSQIGFWANMHRAKTPDTKYLLQVEWSSYTELAHNSDYPTFASSYYLNQGDRNPGKVNIPLADPECKTDFYLVCMDSEKKRFMPLFEKVNDKTIW